MKNTLTRSKTDSLGRRRHYGARLSRLRDKHFMDACRKLMSDPQSNFSSSRALTARAAMTPAPSFYLSFDYALRKIRLIRKGMCHPEPGIRGRKWTEIIDRMERIMERHGIDDSQALARVLESRAPQYYIEPRTALRLYFRIRHRRQTAEKYSQF